MTASPVDLVYVDSVAVAKADVRSYEKNRVRLRMADANEVRSTILAGQFGGLYVTALLGDFDIDTADTTTADDGANCIISFDGFRFKKVATDISSQRKVTASGDVTVSSDDDDIIVIAKTVGAATNVNLPASATLSKPVRIVDGKYDAATHNITLLPNGSETIMGGAFYVIDSNGGSIEMTPLADGSGWI